MLPSVSCLFCLSDHRPQAILGVLEGADSQPDLTVKVPEVLVKLRHCGGSMQREIFKEDIQG